jgi:hypothetical protein
MSLIPPSAWGQMMPASQAALSKGVRAATGRKKRGRGKTRKASASKKRGRKRGKTRTINGRKLTAKQIAAGFGGKKGRKRR